MPEDTLHVYLHDKHIGDLTQDRTRSRFKFLDEISHSRKASPLLSTALLVQDEPFNAAQTANWFTGLLPENDRLTELCRFYGVSQDNYFDVLREVGWECAGAVSILPEGFTPASLRTNEENLIITEEALAARLAALPSHPYDTERSLRVSLGGFQEKMCIRTSSPLDLTQGYARAIRAEIPLDGALSTHILKPQPGRFPGMIEGEAWAMAAASLATPTAATALLEIEGAPLTLIIERFDRRKRDGFLSRTQQEDFAQLSSRILKVDCAQPLVRIHQEDCAQAMGLRPADKYAASSSPRRNDPSFQRIASLLSAYSSSPLEQLEQLLGQMTVNVALGNTDAHAKNYAFLHPDEDTIALAPLYDVVPAAEITPQVVAMGMRIDGRIRLDRIEHEQLLHEAHAWGLPLKRAATVVSETTERLIAGIDRASELYPEAGKRHHEAALKRLGGIRR